MGVCMGKKKRKIQLVREENSNKKRKHVHQTSRSPFHSYKNIVKEWESDRKGKEIHLEANPRLRIGIETKGEKACTGSTAVS
jgi:ACT domain-containing protein